ncbi:MAG: hypothetical protein IH994_09240 [Proteobacteria bacterium]|nr:hypothetical protein [Pseudomonadota bacterium]
MVSLKNFGIGVLLIVFGAVLFPQSTNAAQIRNCGKEIEDDFRKFKQKMRFQGFGRDLTAKKNPKLTQWLEAAHEEVVKHEKAHAKAAGRWGKKIIYRYFGYWGEKYAVAGCVPLRSRMPAKNVLDAALAPDGPSDVDKRIAKQAKRAIELEKKYKRLKAGLKKCGKKLSTQDKAKCKKKYRKRLRGHPFLEIKSLYSW